MIPFQSAYEAFMMIFNLLPEPFKAFIVTCWMLALGITTVTFTWRNS